MKEGGDGFDFPISESVGGIGWAYGGSDDEIIDDDDDEIENGIDHAGEDGE